MLKRIPLNIFDTHVLILHSVLDRSIAINSALLTYNKEINSRVGYFNMKSNKFSPITVSIPYKALLVDTKEIDYNNMFLNYYIKDKPTKLVNTYKREFMVEPDISGCNPDTFKINRISQEIANRGVWLASELIPSLNAPTDPNMHIGSLHKLNNIEVSLIYETEKN